MFLSGSIEVALNSSLAAERFFAGRYSHRPPLRLLVHGLQRGFRSADDMQLLVFSIDNVVLVQHNSRRIVEDEEEQRNILVLLKLFRSYR